MIQKKLQLNNEDESYLTNGGGFWKGMKAPRTVSRLRQAKSGATRKEFQIKSSLMNDNYRISSSPVAKDKTFYSHLNSVTAMSEFDSGIRTNQLMNKT